MLSSNTCQVDNAASAAEQFLLDDIVDWCLVEGACFKSLMLTSLVGLKRDWKGNVS